MAHDQNKQRFLAELSDLGRRYGLGLTGAQLYRLEREDFLFDYSLGNEATLVLGLGDSDSDARAGSGRNAKRSLDPDASAQIN